MGARRPGAVCAGKLGTGRSGLDPHLEQDTATARIDAHHVQETRRVLRRRKSIMMYWPSVTVDVK